MQKLALCVEEACQKLSFCLEGARHETTLSMFTTIHVHDVMITKSTSICFLKSCSTQADNDYQKLAFYS